MKWKFVYRNTALGDAWRKYFDEVDDVELIEDNICRVTCDAVVSPANSFGFMDGGLDYALSERFGWNLQVRLQEMIAKRPLRELLVGEALIIDTEDRRVPWLISAPTMRVPMRLRQSVNAYLAMKAIIISVLSHLREPRIKTVALPGLGTGCGALTAPTAALQMWRAFQEVALGNHTFPADFGEAQRQHFILNRDEINFWDP